MNEHVLPLSSDNTAYFDGVAASWDDLRDTFFPVSLRETAFQRAGIVAGCTAADIGAGSGFLSEGLLNKGLRVTAVDHSDGMIAQLKKRFGKNSLFTVQKGESETLPLDDGTFDYAFANMFLHHVESPPSTIREMARILKPGGKLVITDLDSHRFEFLVREHHDRWMGFTRTNVHRWFGAAGLENVSVTCAGECCTADAVETTDSAEISIFIAIGEKEK